MPGITWSMRLMWLSASWASSHSLTLKVSHTHFTIQEQSGGLLPRAGPGAWQATSIETLGLGQGPALLFGDGRFSADTWIMGRILEALDRLHSVFVDYCSDVDPSTV